MVESVGTFYPMDEAIISAEIEGRAEEVRHDLADDLWVEAPLLDVASSVVGAQCTIVKVAAVSFTEAALGATVAVPTLEGADVTLRLKPGTQPGSRHRVRGQGIGAEGRRGDLIVTVDVVVPEKLSKDEELAVQELAKVLRVPREEKAGNQ